MSPTTGRRDRREVVDRQKAQPRAVPRILGLDEFSVRRGQRYWTGLHDIVGRRVLDVIGGRSQKKVQAALERLAHPEEVRVVRGPLPKSIEQAQQDGRRQFGDQSRSETEKEWCSTSTISLICRAATPDSGLSRLRRASLRTL